MFYGLIKISIINALYMKYDKLRWMYVFDVRVRYIYIYISELEHALYGLKVHIHTSMFQFRNFYHFKFSDTHADLNDLFFVDMPDYSFLILRVKT